MCWYFFYFCPIKETIVACKQQTVIRKPRNAEKQFTKFQSRAPSHDVNCSYVSQARQLIYISPSHAQKFILSTYWINKSMNTPTTASHAWNPSSWRTFPIKQQPEYSDQEKLKASLQKVSWFFFFNMSNDSFLINVFLLSHFRLEVYPHLCTLRRWQIWRLNLLRCMRAKCSSFRYALLRLLNLWMLPLYHC